MRSLRVPDHFTIPSLSRTYNRKLNFVTNSFSCIRTQILHGDIFRCESHLQTRCARFEAPLAESRRVFVVLAPKTESCKSSHTVLPKAWWVGKTNDHFSEGNEASDLFPKADEASQFSGLFLMAFGWYPARIKALFSLTITKCTPYHMPS